MTNPYGPPSETEQAAAEKGGKLRLSATAFTALGLLVGCSGLKPLIMSPERLLDVLSLDVLHRDRGRVESNHLGLLWAISGANLAINPEAQGRRKSTVERVLSAAARQRFLVAAPTPDSWFSRGSGCTNVVCVLSGLCVSCQKPIGVTGGVRVTVVQWAAAPSLDDLLCCWFGKRFFCSPLLVDRKNCIRGITNTFVQFCCDRIVTLLFIWSRARPDYIWIPKTLSRYG